MQVLFKDVWLHQKTCMGVPAKVFLVSWDAWLLPLSLVCSLLSKALFDSLLQREMEIRANIRVCNKVFTSG